MSFVNPTSHVINIHKCSPLVYESINTSVCGRPISKYTMRWSGSILSTHDIYTNALAKVGCVGISIASSLKQYGNTRTVPRAILTVQRPFYPLIIIRSI
jgi:hypothetical protein